MGTPRAAATQCPIADDANALMFTNWFTGALLDVRLIGSTLATEGRLEVNYDGIWGTVCDDLFDDVDASVACYMLGFR